MNIDILATLRFFHPKYYRSIFVRHDKDKEFFTMSDELQKILIFLMANILLYIIKANNKVGRNALNYFKRKLWQKN